MAVPISVRSIDSRLTCDQLEAQGFTHLMIRCACGSSTAKPFLMRELPGAVPIYQLRERLRCKDARCRKIATDCYGWASAANSLAEGTQHAPETRE